MVDGSEERRERFSGAGRREDEHALAIRYCGPGELLRACRRLECRLEPGSRRRIECRERITPHEDDAKSDPPAPHRYQDNKRGPPERAPLLDVLSSQVDVASFDPSWASSALMRLVV